MFPIVFYLSMLETEQEMQSFTAAYQKYRHQALYVALEQTGNQAMAEDALHNAFMEIIEKNRDYLELPDKNLRPLLMRIVKSRAIDLLRKEHLSRREEINEDDILPDEKDISVEIASNEGYQTLMDCIGRLERIYRVTCDLSG